MNNPTEQPVASVIKRLLALSYDLFILFALSMAYSALATVFMVFTLGIDADNYLPMQKGIWFGPGWVVTIMAFYWFFWYRAGQTVGMKAWRLKLISNSATRISHKQCFIRVITGPFALGLFGLGYVWSFFDKQKLALHDRLSNTRVVIMPKIPKK